MSIEYSQDRRFVHNPAKIPTSGDRRKPRSALDGPLPPPQRPEHPLGDPSDWSFELIHDYHEVIKATARRFGLDTYPNQLEIITDRKSVV